MAPSQHNEIQEAVGKDSIVTSNGRRFEKIPKEELVAIEITTMPPTTNSLYQGFGGRRFVNPKAKAAKESIAWEAKSQYKNPPIEGELIVEVHLRWGTKRKHDVDNIKSLLDALTGILWIDDSQIVDLRITKRYDKENEGLDLIVLR